MFSPHNIRAAIYVSMGTPERDQDTEMAEPHQYALRMGWKVLEYRERRGRVETRPALGQLMYRVRRRVFDVVLVESMDCFARSLAELAENVTRLYREGVRFLSLSEGIDIDPETVAGRNFLRTLTIAAQLDIPASTVADALPPVGG
jgi:DNA invertase Pin-like site-specific DNA recombinase